MNDNIKRLLKTDKRKMFITSLGYTVTIKVFADGSTSCYINLKLSKSDNKHPHYATFLQEFISSSEYITIKMAYRWTKSKKDK